MRITESKLRSIIREVIKESNFGSDREALPAAPDWRAYAGDDVERRQYLEMLKNGMTLEEMGFDDVSELASALRVDIDIAEALCDGYGCA
jgi:hypothetical protein